ncbi:MAG: response regulator transcription factor [Saprospiraceae bacterium]|nr:response regulator transcription factor [Saprospiraceae bacterium]
MSIRTIIIDDDAIWRDLTTEFVKMNTLLDLVGTFDSAIAAYPFLMKEKVDLVLLDVEMPQLDGLKFAKSLTHPPLIVFITSHAESAVEGFEVAATDFLVKPFTFERFFKMTERVRQTLAANTESLSPPQYESINDNYFFIRSNNSFVKINTNEVLFIKAMENFIQIVTPQQKYTALIPLSTAEEQLPSDKFMRVHRSYIVNAQNISVMNKDHIIMDEFNIPISEQYRENILKTIIESNLLKK